MQRINEHTHVDDGCNVQRARIAERVREEASTSRENPEMLISNATFGLNDEVRAVLHVPNLKRTVQRERVRNQAAPVKPQSLETLIIPDEYQRILLDANFGEEQFLLYDSGEEESRILIFGTDDNLAVLGRSEKWQCDGTFKVAPMLTAHYIRFMSGI